MHEYRKYLHIDYTSYIFKKNIFYSAHIKIAYTKKYIAQKINQSIFKSSWVPNLAKCMHVMCENNERYDCKTARWIQKINAMHVNPKHKWCMKKILVKNLEIENFSISIDRASISIKYQSSQADSNQKLLSQFRSIEKQIRSIENLKK